MAKTAQEKLDAKAEKQYYKTHKRSYKLTTGDIVFNILNYGFFLIFTLSCIFPFYYLFINTISSNDLVSRGLINFIPRGLNLDNYVNLVKSSEIGQAFFCFYRENPAWNGAYGDGFCFCGISGNKAADVAQKVLVSFSGDYHVLQCRNDSLVFEYVHAGADQQFYGIHNPGHCGAL